MAQIKEMSELFGFENTSNIFLIYNSPAKPLDPRSSPHVVGWTRAYLGTIIYEGHLLELLNGQPDRRGRVYDVRNKTIVLGDRLYKMSYFELSLCEEIADGIYILRPMNYTSDSLERALLANYRMLYDFYISSDNWNIVTRTLNTSLKYIKYDTGYGLIVTIYEGAKGWLTFEKFFDSGLNATVFQSVIIRLKSNAANATLLLEVYYEDGKVRGRTLEGVSGDLWLVAPVLSDDGAIVKIRFGIWVKEPLAISGKLVLKYMVFI